MYRNYIFDLYGTLADIRTDEENPWLWEKMSEIYRALGAGYGPWELKETFRNMESLARKFQTAHMEEGQGQECCFRNNNSLETYVETDLTKVFSGLYQKKGVFCDDAMAKMTAVIFRTLSRKYLRLYDGVEELLGELRRRGKGVYLLSNAQSDFTRPEMEMLGIGHYFDGIFISSEQGYKKPSPVFFGRLLEQYGLEPSESIMIGNDEEADIAGAKGMGMAALYIHTGISPVPRGRSAADYCVMDGDFRKVGRLILREND